MNSRNEESKVTLRFCPSHYKVYIEEVIPSMPLKYRILTKIALRLGAIKVVQLTHMQSDLCFYCKFGSGGYDKKAELPPTSWLLFMRFTVTWGWVLSLACLVYRDDIFYHTPDMSYDHTRRIGRCGYQSTPVLSLYTHRSHCRMNMEHLAVQSCRPPCRRNTY